MSEPADDSLEDERLARLVASGDAAAEAALCARLYPRIRAYGRRHLRDEAAAADLAQTVLVIALEALRERRVESLPQFVMGACRNTVSDWRRTHERRRALLEKFGDHLSHVAEPAPGLDGERLNSCFDRLGARERTVLVMTFYAEQSGDEIARQLAMTPGNVRVARHRALKQLHACMQEGA
jgi:RNA polymerase sigma-70 factor (ECF subfamily)